MSTDTGFILVGVDHGREARGALAFALNEGVAHGWAVEVVTAWLWSSPYEGMDRVRSLQDGHRNASDVQETAVRAAMAGLAEPPVLSRIVVHGCAGPALVRQGADAGMLVVGTARKGGVRRAVLGSVSEYCVRHAAVPVVVVADAEKLTHRSLEAIEKVVS